MQLKVKRLGKGEFDGSGIGEVEKLLTMLIFSGLKK
jgi:hypothetical protein